MIPGSYPRAERRRLVIYVALIVATTGAFAVIGIVTGKPALVAAAITALVLILGRTLLNLRRERVRERRERD